MSKDLLELENGIFMKGSISNFRLVSGDTNLTPACHRLGYIKGILVAVKCEKAIVYKPEIEIIDDVPTLVKIAEFCTYKPGAYLKVTIGEKTYVIDSNLQITSCSCIRLH